MLINLSEIMSVHGKVLCEDVYTEKEQFQLDGDAYNFVKKGPVKLTITNLTQRKVLIELDGLTVLNIPCNRCLEDVETEVKIHMSRKLDFNETTEERLKELDETSYIDGYYLDVDKLIFNEVMVGFPMKVLCGEDCEGICSVCGINLNHEACTCDREVLDPRMSIIRDIFKNS